jgi:hypothetical protein
VESKQRSKSDTRNSEEMKMDSEGGKRKEKGQLSRSDGGLRIGR